jgi:ApaG protein
MPHRATFSPCACTEADAEDITARIFQARARGAVLLECAGLGRGPGNASHPTSMTERTPENESNETSGGAAAQAASDPARAHKIRVDVSANYVGEQSKPEEGHYAFSYTITIRNEGQVPARLLTRHWVITDANGKVKEVRGEGVVGEQPYLLPGQGFRYSSGAVLETPVGAPIAPFTLAMPGLLH